MFYSAYYITCDIIEIIYCY